MSEHDLDSSKSREETPGDIIEIFHRTVGSERRRGRNEDTVFANSQENIFGVLDGMGGHLAGEEASSLASDIISIKMWRIPKDLSLRGVEDRLLEILRESNEKIIRKGRERIEFRDMGTTACVGLIWEGKKGERKLVLGNVGDSRAYIFKKRGGLRQITLDDSSFIRMIEGREGREKAYAIQQKFSNVVDPKTDNERLYFNSRSILSLSIGKDKQIKKDAISTLDIKAGDRVVLMTDGVHDNLTDREIEDILKAETNNKAVVDMLIENSLVRSRESKPRSKSDDMSVLIVEILGSEEGGKSRFRKLFKRRENGKRSRTEINERDINEIYREIDDIGEIRLSSGKVLSANDVKDRIKLVLAGKIDLRAIPRRHGLRQEVEKILKQKTNKKN